ncbi:MAG: ABC transporter permease [Anaerolineaceae bacterium]|nr:ABC transporter permease [Anaerolineaceae bacterium]MCB9099327.1 ABC transporter permease [Anaerolineales bacterium]
MAGQAAQSPSEYIQSYLKRVTSGDLGSLPIILGLILIAIIFQSQNENFLTARNFVNLIVQMAGVTTIAYGVVFVLLIGEIDLSIGYVSAVAAVTMTLLLREPGGWPWYAALGLALVAVALIGMVQGLIITTFQLPSFVVTLAGLLAWNGVVLIMIGGAGTVIIQDSVIVGIANYFLPAIWGWILALVFVAGYTLTRVRQVIARRNQGLSTTPMLIVVLQIVGLAILSLLAVYVCNHDRGVPFVGIILLVFLVGFSFLATKTPFGRYVYAVGGNKEAARRAGISVQRIQVIVFMISSAMAGMGGIILASRLRSVDTAAGGGNLLLNAIAAAVIGGTSLFGGSGRVSSAVLGALIIMSVENGMGLLGLSSGVKFVITGLVLLLAVLVDAISRRSRTQSGLA